MRQTKGGEPERVDSSAAGRSQARGGVTALEALHEAQHRRALSVAYRILEDLSEAEDVVQEVFLAAWRSGYAHDPTRGSVSTWIVVAARHRAIGVLRTRHRRPTRMLELGAELSDGSDVASEVATAVDFEVVRRALASLLPEQRQVLDLAYFGGLSQSEIAASLGLPLGTVKGRTRLALDHLRSALAVVVRPSIPPESPSS